MNSIKLLGAVFGLIILTGLVHARMADKKVLTWDGAKKIIAAAMAEAKMKDAAADESSPVIYIGHEQVAAAFAKGMPLVETDGYKVHASRREKPGEAEIHAWETDVIYVLEGSAMFVTGGDVPDGRTISPGEIRGKGITGGQAHALRKGDVIVVPKGVPHWFKEVQAPFLYFVVKPISKDGAGK